MVPGFGYLLVGRTAIRINKQDLTSLFCLITNKDSIVDMPARTLEFEGLPCLLSLATIDSNRRYLETAFHRFKAFHNIKTQPFGAKATPAPLILSRLNIDYQSSSLS